MKRIALLFVAVSCLLVVSGRHHRDLGFLNHVQMVNEFRCSSPQPRAVSVTELLRAGPSPDEIFYPPSTVLARCNGSGCCRDSKQICAPIETRNVSLVFMVKHIVDKQRDRHHEIIHALEDTKCACMDATKVKST